MNSHCVKFLESIEKISIGAKEAKLDVTMEWLPEIPPVTILFGAIGYRIAEDFDRNEARTNQEIFALIEQAMDSPDDLLGTAVATGLIEDMATRALQIEGVWGRIVPSLGPQSLAHANAWIHG